MRPVTGAARIAAGTAISKRAWAAAGNGYAARMATSGVRAAVAKRNDRFLKKVAKCDVKPDAEQARALGASTVARRGPRPTARDPAPRANRRSESPGART